jgi:hypothetical protein
MTNVTLTPRIGMTELIYSIGGVVTAFHLDKSGNIIAYDVSLYPDWSPPCLLIPCAKLAIHIETPHEQLTTL